jgi:hypothetical protein
MFPMSIFRVSRLRIQMFLGNLLANGIFKGLVFFDFRIIMGIFEK